MHIQQFTFNAFQTRCCAVWDEEGYCAFIDPGCASASELSQITALVSERKLKPVCIMLTHAHFDHIYGMAALAKEYDIPVYAHHEETFTIEKTNPQVCRAYGLPLPELHPFTYVSEGDNIEVGSLRFFAAAERVLFSGDSLFAGAIGRTDHPGGDYDLLMKSIFEKLLPLDDSKAPVKVIPGHGPCTDLATEGMTNPFLLPFNEPYEDYSV